MRVFINNKATRHQLELYASDALQPKDYPKLKELLRLYQPCMAELLDDIEENQHDSYMCPKILKPLIRNLAKSSPVCALIEFNEYTHSIMGRLSDTDIVCVCSPKELMHLRESCPLISDLVQSVDELSASVKRVIKVMIRIACEPFLNRPAHALGPARTTVGAEFPTLPELCCRGDYVLDSKTSNTSCNKTFRGHPSLTPGLFTLSCPHGKIIFF